MLLINHVRNILTGTKKFDQQSTITVQQSKSSRKVVAARRSKLGQSHEKTKNPENKNSVRNSASAETYDAAKPKTLTQSSVAANQKKSESKREKCIGETSSAIKVAAVIPSKPKNRHEAVTTVANSDFVRNTTTSTTEALGPMKPKKCMEPSEFSVKAMMTRPTKTTRRGKSDEKTSGTIVNDQRSRTAEMSENSSEPMETAMIAKFV